MNKSKQAVTVDRRISGILLAWFLGLAAAPASSFAQALPRDLTLLSLEELMDIQVTSASRKEQPLEDSAAAAFVITREAIRRSGMTTIPDLLRRGCPTDC